MIQKWQHELATDPESTRQLELPKRIARFEDAGHGACLLSILAYAAVVESCLLRADGVRYRLIEWCVMPNHVHVLIETMQGMRLGDIVRSWKTYSPKTMNGSSGRLGSIWEEDYHDRYIRDMDHFHATKAYIRRNPVSAGLYATPEDWPWSSAARR